MNNLSFSNPSKLSIPKILFVDNQKGLDIEINKALEKTGKENQFEFVFVNTVKEALVKLKETPFLLVMTEIILPIVNGYYLLDFLSQFNHSTSVIVYTNLTNSEDLNKIRSYNVDNLFLKKLTSVNALIDFIRTGQYKSELGQKVKELLQVIKTIQDEEKEKVSKFTQCPRCHLILSPNAHFCNSCGQKIFKKTVQPLHAEISPQVDLPPVSGSVSVDSDSIEIDVNQIPAK